MKSQKVIVVVEAGWVFLAEDSEEREGKLWLTDASTIRLWGTTKGLGEIALSGPTKTTILDYCGNPSVPLGKVLFTIPCTY